MKEIMIWSDFACPFCYIGEKHLQDAIDDLGLKKDFKIIYRAFQLNPHAPKETEDSIPELIAKKYNLSLVDATKRVNEIDDAGNAAGLVFNYATAKSTNTLDAHRLMKLAEDNYGEKVTSALNEQLFLAYFTYNRNISDHEVLEQCGVNAGIPTEEISRILNSNRYVEEVRHDENEAHKLGVQGVPFIVFDNKIAVPGALSVDDFKKVIQDVLKDTSADDVASKARSCGENGCSLD